MFKLNEASAAIVIQGGMVILLFLGALIGTDRIKAGSLGLGGCLCWVPNLFFYYQVFRYKGVKAKKIVMAFFWGEALKFSVTLLFFGLVLCYIKWVNVSDLLIGYIITQLSFWVVPFYGYKFNSH